MHPAVKTEGGIIPNEKDKYIYRKQTTFFQALYRLLFAVMVVFVFAAVWH